MVTKPLCTCQRRMTCALLLPYFLLLGEDGLLQEGAVSVAQRVPALDRYALCRQELPQPGLLEVRVELGLEDDRPDLADGEASGTCSSLKLERPGTGLALLAGLHHELVACKVVPNGQVEKEEVDVVGAQALEGLLHRIGSLIEGGQQLGL